MKRDRLIDKEQALPPLNWIQIENTEKTNRAAHGTTQT